MKMWSVLFLLVSASVFAKEMNDFNAVLIENVKKDIKNENDLQFRSKSSRAPASIKIESESESEHENPIQEVNKIDKMNIRQIGPNKW